MFRLSVSSLVVGYFALILISFLPSFHRLSLSNKNSLVGILFLVILGPLFFLGVVRLFIGVKQRLWFAREFKVSEIVDEILSPAIGDLYEIYSYTRSTDGRLKAGSQFCAGLIVSLPRLWLKVLAIAFFENVSNQELQDESLDWYGQMVYASRNLLTEEDKQSLQEWDDTMVDGSGNYATSDWPGWEKYIGLPPWKQKR